MRVRIGPAARVKTCPTAEPLLITPTLRRKLLDRRPAILMRTRCTNELLTGSTLMGLDIEVAIHGGPQESPRALG